VGQRRGRVALLQGCVMGSVFGDTNASTARVLARNGVEVIAAPDQTCCGALHAHAGERERARDLARRNIAAFERSAVDAVIVNAAGCGAAMKEYGWLLKDDPGWSSRASAFCAKVRYACYVLGVLGRIDTVVAIDMRVN